MKAQCRCGKILIIPNDQMGQRGICPRCGNRMLIPSLVGSVVASSAPSFVPQEKPPAPPAPSESEKGAPVEEERILPKKESEQASQEPAAKDRLREVKGCPFCGEEILTIAIKCKHCGEWLSEEKRAEEAAKAAAVDSHEKPAPIPFVEMTPVTPVASATPPAPIPPAPQPRQRTPLPTRPCPTCKKDILSVATLCRHCGSPTDLRPRQMRNPYFGIHATVMVFALVATVGTIFPLVDQKEAKSFFDERKPEAGVVVAAAGLLILFGAILSAARKFFSPAYLLGGAAIVGMAVLEYFRYPGADSTLGIGPAIFIVGGSGFTIFLCGIVGFFMKRRLTPRPKAPVASPSDAQEKSE